MATKYGGSFTADGNAKIIQLRSDVDWMTVWNQTVLDATGAGTGAKFEWQRGMTTDTGIEYKKTAATEALQIDMLTSGGFTLIDSSASPLGALNSTVSAVSNASPPLVSATSTSTLVDGDIVRMINVTGAQQLGGIDFTISNLVANTEFNLAHMAAITAGTTGYFYPVNYDALYYPRRRYISAISQAASALVTLTVTHGYTVGQKVRFIVPSAYGMTQMNNLTGTITAIGTANTWASTNTITVDIDSTAFTAFAFPATAAAPFTPAQVIPLGEAGDATYANLLDDATYNTGYIGMSLAAGTDSPAGATNDVIYWRAGTFDSINNE